ncbi:hypothetical protein [Vulgatibacter incomptus]|uniref:Right handed beta helix domain-containing protein n=1 Tax=Vulgatibacter incomptus TaxID=1391653 RepID=A0A0K1PCL2_9BACT|nr:hypothetical protein [Vulgatibacter incomptus]AKU90859.1 hypothetical protein AKJ08_1246 [Vulgatibacter incomptus]
MALAGTILLGISCTSEPAKPLFAGEGLQRNRDQLDLRRAYRLPQECAAGSLPRFDAVAGEWLCGSVASVIAEGAGWVLDPAHRLPRQCAAGSLPRFDTVVAEWTCGSVESVIAEGAGWVLDPTNRLPERCAKGETVKWSGTRWACAGGDSERVIVVRATDDFFGNAADLRAAVKRAEEIIMHHDDGDVHPNRDIVVQLEPGTYVIGTKALNLPAGVSLEGIGPEVLLEGGWSGEPVVSMMYVSELRRLMIRSSANGISVHGSSMRLEDVRIASEGSAVFGDAYSLDIVRCQLFAGWGDQFDGIALSGASDLSLENSVVFATGASVRVIGDRQAFVSVQGGALYGTIALKNASAKISGARIKSEAQPLFSLGANTSVEVRASELAGTRLREDTTTASTLRVGGSSVSVSEAGDAPSKCVHSYDADFEPLNPDCSPAVAPQ